MHFNYIAITLLAPFAIAAPTPISNVDDSAGLARPVHALQERQSSGSSSAVSPSLISTVISAALPFVEQLMSSMLPQLEKMLTGALSKKVKRDDGSVVYEIVVPQAVE